MASLPRPGHVALLIPLALAATWLAVRARGVREDPGEVLAALRSASGPSLPAASSAGAQVRSEVEEYDRESLYEFIDGAAEAYLARGFQCCVAATYEVAAPGSPALEIAAEVYRFKDAAGAQALFDEERPSAAAAVPGIEGAVSDGTVLAAVAGRDYLKLTSLSGGDRVDAQLRYIAAAWRGRT